MKFRWKLFTLINRIFKIKKKKRSNNGNGSFLQFYLRRKQQSFLQPYLYANAIECCIQKELATIAFVAVTTTVKNFLPVRIHINIYVCIYLLNNSFETWLNYACIKKFVKFYQQEGQSKQKQKATYSWRHCSSCKEITV